MQTPRDANLQVMLDHAERAILARGDDLTRSAARRVFQRLSEKAGREVQLPAARLPVCSHLEAIYAGMAAGASPLPDIASAFAALESRFNWTRRKGADPADMPFYDGHGNVTIIGPGGIEERDDVWVGATVMAPGITYPDHHHPPEEVYLSFTDGEWWNADMDWTAPGPGGLIYNRPDIMHAMRSGPRPFLALWLLPT
jgi:hypothetical protein